MKPLDGLRVLDLTRVMAGPFCTALLADLGAEVIKLEPPQGDDYRHIGPFVAGQSALFTLMNRGKQSIVLDLKDPAAQATARAIALRCDVVIENFRPGVASRLGLGPDLRDEKPELIYASISGFGQSGPAAHLPAYDLVAQAMSGLMAATGEAGGPPLKVGESYGDLMAGLYASWAILAALHQRHTTGAGSTIDVAMFDALFSLLPTSHAVQFYGGTPPQRVGNRHPLSTPFGCFATADGQAVIAVLGDRQWQQLCTVIGQPQAAQDPRFVSDESRTALEPVVKAMIEAWSRDLPTAAVVAALTKAGIPTAPIQHPETAANSDHAVARGLVSDLPHSVLGTARTVGQPVRFDGHLRARYLPDADLGLTLGAFALTEPGAGSDPADMKTRAVRHGDADQIAGRKCFISNGGIADFIVVYAVTDPTAGHHGISAFVVDKSTPGLTPGRVEATMGLKGGHVVELDFDVVVPAANRVGPEGSGFRTAMKVLDNGRVEVAAMCIRIASQALDLAVQWAKTRIIGSEAFASRQGIRWQLADRATDLQCARLLALEAARLRQNGKRFTQSASMAKLYAAEMAHRVTDGALQIHGGYGYTRDLPLERRARDVRIMRIYEGSPEIQRNIIAAQMLN